MGEFKFIGTSIRIAGDPTFIPNLQDPKRNHAMVTGMINRKVNGKDLTDEITLNFWGKSASVAANFLPKGKQCNIEGRLQSYTMDTGQVRESGKRILNRRIEVSVARCELLADPRREMEVSFANGITALKAAGRLPGNVQMGLDDILPKKSAMVDFNPQLAAQTGKYGHARVWSKEQGFWGNVVPAQTTVVANTNAAIQQLQNQIATLTAAAGLTNTEAAVVTDPAQVAAAEAAVVVEAPPDPFIH